MNTRIGKKTSVDQVYDEIRRKIIDAQFMPGSQMLEQELAVMLGVSRTPVREAIVRLQSEGLLELIPRHGVRILPMSPIEMKEIYEILASLESTAAELIAARGATEQELQTLKLACLKMNAAFEAGRIEEWSAADEEFHLQLIRMSGNARLADIILNCWDRVHRARKFTLLLRPHLQTAKSNSEHQALLDAISNGDVKKAGRISRRHRERGGNEQIDILKTFRIQQI